MNNPKLLFVDSGVGGLSIVDEVRKLIPSSQNYYVADNAAYPYGRLTEQQVVERVLEVIPPFIERFQPDLMILACNTASTAALSALREAVPLPIIGVVPAIKPAATASKSKRIALLATPGTIVRSYTDNLIRDFAQGCQVLKLGSSELVQQAEFKLQGEQVDLDCIAREIAPLVDPAAKVDKIVLGCTHFPLLREELKLLIPPQVELVDSGSAIARRVVQLLQPQTWESTPHLSHFYYTKETDMVDKISAQLGRFGFAQLQFLNVTFQQIT